MPHRAVLVGALTLVAGRAMGQWASTGPAPSRLGEGDVFTVIGLPDTQNYSEFYPDIYRSQTEWIVRERGNRNIRFVSHFGDVVNNGDREQEWRNAKAAMSLLDRANIPYGVTAGNHDVTPSGQAGTPYIPQKFLENYGPQVFAGRSWYGGASPSGMSSFQIFEGGGRQFLALHLLCDTPVAELAWAQGVLNRHRDKPTMMTTHRYLQDAEDYTSGVPIVPSGRYPSVWYNVEGIYTPGGIQSEELFNSFVRTNRQIFMVNCGHFHEEFRQTSTNLYGLPVHEVLADYQDDPSGGNGWLRAMEFDPARNRIKVESYSPWLNQHRRDAESDFTLTVEFDRYARRNSLSFQDGINGYSGTRDTWLNQDQPNRAYGGDATFDVDDDTTNSVFSDRRGQALLRFDDVFTSSPTGPYNRVPLGARIVEATLRLVLSDDIDTPLYDPSFELFMMTRDWGESSTWNSMGNGLQPGQDYGAFVGRFSGDNNPNDDWWRVIDVRAAVQAWANGQANFGFAILPQIITGNDDGISVWASENGNPLFRPVLDVTWEFPGLVPAPGALTLAGLAGLGAARRRRA